MKKIALIPIDNRPICHTLVEQICAIHKGIELFLPPREMLGGLVEGSDVTAILGWLEGLPEIDYLILSLDTIAYGGLVNSRRAPENYDEILARIKRLEAVLGRLNAKVYAFSSIMRISNNNINEEEKPYWSEFGKKIFEYSYNLHKSRRLKSANCVINTVPKEILRDYLATRERNFKINKYYLELAQRGVFDTLVYSKDDTGEFGLNVEEAETLGGLIESTDTERALIKTGADEIPLTLLARAIGEGATLSVRPIFLRPEGAAKISKYEDIPLEECVKSQLSLAGAKIADNGADLNFIINNFSEIQGDLVLGEANLSAVVDFEHSQPYFIADVNNANGADFDFVSNFLNGRVEENFYGYCAYNTSANSIGCAVCVAVAKFFATSAGQYDDDAFKKLMLVRFLDDWAYQAHIRKSIREGGKLQGFKPFEQKICKFLALDCDKIEYRLPWNRSFEVEVIIC